MSPKLDGSKPGPPAPPPAVALDRRDLVEQRIDVAALQLELAAAVLERLDEPRELPAVALARIVEVEDLADLGEREPEPLAAQDQLDAGPLALAVDPRLAGAPGREQPLVLVEPDRARRQRELGGELRDRVLGVAACGAGLGGRRAAGGGHRRGAGNGTKQRRMGCLTIS